MPGARRKGRCLHRSGHSWRGTLSLAAAWTQRAHEVRALTAASLTCAWGGRTLITLALVGRGAAHSNSATAASAATPADAPGAIVAG